MNAVSEDERAWYMPALLKQQASKQFTARYNLHAGGGLWKKQLLARRDERTKDKQREKLVRITLSTEKQTNKKHLTPGCENQGIEQSSKVAASHTHTHRFVCVCFYKTEVYISTLCIQ